MIYTRKTSNFITNNIVSKKSSINKNTINKMHDEVISISNNITTSVNSIFKNNNKTDN